MLATIVLHLLLAQGTLELLLQPVLYAPLVEYVSRIALHLYNLVVFLEILETYRALFNFDLRLALPEYLPIERLDHLLVPLVRGGLIVGGGRTLG